MQNDAEIPLEDLIVHRQQLQDFCSAHFSSLMAFQEGVSFKVYPNEGPLGNKPRHLSSTATCVESLLECQTLQLVEKDSLNEIAIKFAALSIERPAGDWKSDGSAHIYCRCRTLPLVVSHLPKYNGKIEEHLDCIFQQLRKHSSRFAIGEAWGQAKDPYPPNAYHTCWTLQLLHTLEHTFPKDFPNLDSKYRQRRLGFARIRGEMLLWAKHMAGYQMALHAAQSSTLDSDQLAWSLGILMKFDEDFQANLPQQDFIRQGLKALFEEQTNIGIWRTGAPLFHYQRSGNAYCYVFETLAALLKGVLTHRNEGVFLRQILRPYVGNLLPSIGPVKSEPRQLISPPDPFDHPERCSLYS